MSTNVHILPFHVFVQSDEYGVPRYNNFWMYFIDVTGTSGEIYRKAGHFSAFRSGYPEMADTLTEEITAARTGASVIASIRPYERELYYAYVIMRKFASDEELFA